MVRVGFRVQGLPGSAWNTRFRVRVQETVFLGVQGCEASGSGSRGSRYRVWSH